MGGEIFGVRCLRFQEIQKLYMVTQFRARIAEVVCGRMCVYSGMLLYAPTSVFGSMHLSFAQKLFLPR